MKNRPSGIDERPEQLRPPVVKAFGVTESERYLAKLADKSFLNLWSYSSPFRDQKQDGKGDGKELCDLLIVCGRDIIIFSEKTIEWSTGDLDIAWCRWARQALKKSAKQAKGAERWIAEFPDRIFLDRECTAPFPIDFPASDEQVFHRVLVARGAARACQKQITGSSGSMIIVPSIKGSSHWSNQGLVQPFCIGDLEPNGSFVHVFDEIGLDIVLAELDTVRDFTDYLTKRGNFIRSGGLSEAHGEENLLAYYAVRINSDGDHDFVREDETKPLVIDRHQYRSMIADPRYIAKKQENKISYLWDALIEVFTSHMLDGTSITFDNHGFELRKNELGARYMALQPRFIRRGNSEAFHGALEKGRNVDRFFRAVFAQPESKENETAFFIQTVKYLDRMESSGGYEQYRRNRAIYAVTYAKGLLERHPHLKRVIGISCEPPGQGRGSSEDMVYAEQLIWTDEERLAIKKECETLGVLQGKLKEKSWSGQEFPDINTMTIRSQRTDTNNGAQNRQQRRAMRAKARKKR